LIEWDQSNWETWNVLFSSSCVHSGPTISITVANLGPNRNLLNYCAVPKLRLFPFIISVISWCESCVCERLKWEKIANIWRQNFTFDRKLAFPPHRTF
jgi:hypothetical protein